MTGMATATGKAMIMMAMATAPGMAMAITTVTVMARVMTTAKVMATGYCKTVYWHKCTNANTKIAHSWVTHSVIKNVYKRHSRIHTGSPHMHMGIVPKKMHVGTPHLQMVVVCIF